MRRVLLAVAVLACALTPAGATASAPAAHLGELVSGTAQYVNGTYVWTDYAYDDTGFAYSPSQTNGADLIQLQAGMDDDEVVITALLQTLTFVGGPRLSVGFDTDRDASTGGAALPGLGTPALGGVGLEAAVQTSGTALTVLTPDGEGGWSATYSATAALDVHANTITARIPRSVLDPGTAIWRAHAALGIGSSTTIADLAFVGEEAASGWQNAKQSAAIKAGDGAAAAADIDFARVAGGATTAPDITRAGLHTLLYRSALELGEGIKPFTIRTPGGGSAPLGNLYAGRYQPYLVWVPENLPAQPPLILYLHGLSGTHTSSAGAFGPPKPPSQPQDVFLGSGGFEPRAVVAMPLGRGEQSFYLGAGEQDVLDVADDAQARYGADPDRVVLAGVSMGGFGAFRLGILRPDRWSAVVPLIGTARSAQALTSPAVVPGDPVSGQFSPSAFPSGAGELMSNLLNVPVRMVNGQVDPIVNYSFAVQDAAWMTALGIDHKAWVLHRRQHEVVPAITNCVLEEAISMRRVNDPSHINFTVEPGTFVEDPQSGLSLRHDAAYWISDVAVDPFMPTGQVSAESFARPHGPRGTHLLAEAGDNLAAGADLCGPREGMSTGDTWRMTGIALSEQLVEPTFNAVDISTRDVIGITVDLDRAGIDADEQIVVTTAFNQPASLTLRAPWTGAVRVEMTREEPVVMTPENGAIVLTVGPLTGIVTVTPVSG